mmetsp:Transcript_56077/g.119390  ORF Transcript_56077/g.119390 Transcript_56077/m.119390 type:complete len:265 (-) Transcript_56077:126-920(-)
MSLSSSNGEVHGLLEKDLEGATKQRIKPVQWQGCLKPGAGQYEEQGFENWTPAEQKEWDQGILERKLGVGQVSIRLPIRSVGQFVGLVYGYLPFIVPIWWALWAAVSYARYGVARFFPLYGLCIAVGFAIVNEAITKRICRKLLPESITNRPPEAVCNHPGMPSGHVMNAYTLMIWCLLEAALDEFIHPEWLIIILLVMGPVPWARVYNKDHTVAQVTASAVASCVMGSVAYYIRKRWYPDMGQPWDWYYVNKSYHNPYAVTLT